MIPENCQEWLQNQYDKSKSYQNKDGIIFQLSFNEYLSLWSRDKLKKISKWIEDGEIGRRQKHPRYAWVLSWRSKQDRKDGVMDKHTARILTRAQSEKRFLLQKGEKHTPEAKAKIGAAHKGKKITAEHREAIGRTKRGKAQTPEQIAKRVAATAATKARKAAEKVALEAATVETVICEQQDFAERGAMQEFVPMPPHRAQTASMGVRTASSAAAATEAHAQ